MSLADHESPPESPDVLQLPALRLPEEGEEGSAQPLPSLDLIELARRLPQDRHLLSVTRSAPPRSDDQLPWRLLLTRRQRRGQGPSAEDILKALEPLRARRHEHRPPLYLDLEGEAPPTEEQLADWIEASGEELDESPVLLIAGDPADLPFSLEALLRVGRQVGRLGFPTSGGYAAYAEKIRRYEEAGRRSPGRVVGMSSVMDTPTRRAHDFLFDPLLSELEGDHPGRVARIARPTMGVDLGSAVAGSGEGAPVDLLVVSSHGAEQASPTSPRQGAPSDKLGPIWTASDIRPGCGDRAGGGVVLLFACNSAGTPRHRPWITALNHRGVTSPPHDTLSALPMALLAHDGGPIGVVGHADVVFLPALADRHGVFGPERVALGSAPMRDLAWMVLGGAPIGAALLRQARSTAGQGASLLRRIGPQLASLPPEKARELAIEWLRWHDGAGWLVLGDPLAAVGGAAQPLSVRQAFRGR